MKFSFPYTDRQRVLIGHPAKILHVGTGTKTGKTLGLLCWLVEGLLKGEACSYVGPWFFRSLRSFSETKNLLQPFIANRTIRVNEARLQLVSQNGGYLDFTSADNPDAAFGGNYDRVVVDEASRCPRQIYAAALTTISATDGRLRLAFNLELGAKNWAISNLLRVQRMSPEERERTGEDLLTFPTDAALVAPALIELMRSQMPEVMWRALYLGEVPTSDCSLFRNLDKIFVGSSREEPVDGASYVMGLDLARKSDFSVAMVIDGDGRVVHMDRFNLLSWNLQVERVAQLYRTFHCSKVVADATGVGDAVIESLEAQGLTVEPYIFTVPSRRMLLEELILSCDNCSITIPDTENFRVCRNELESFEYTMDGSTIRYEAPAGSHDDAVMALALAVHGWRASRGLVLGWLDLLRRTAKDIAEGVRDRFGELIHKPAPKPVLRPAPARVETKPVVVDNFAIWLRTSKAPPCPACGATCTVYNELRKIRCNQCQAVDGVPPPKPVGQCCPNFLAQVAGGGVRCGSCGWQSNQVPAGVGMSRKDYAAGAGRFRGFGRFG